MKLLTPRRPRILKITLFAVALLILCHIIAFIAKPFLYLNLSPSQPRGLYLRQPSTGPLEVGDLVLLDVPKYAQPYIYGRRWLPYGAPLLKRVGALSGDEYQIQDSGFYLHGTRVGPVFNRDKQGLPLPRRRGSFRVRVGHFLPIATRIPHSFDGRYFGDVSLKLIRGKARPLLVVDDHKD